MIDPILVILIIALVIIVADSIRKSLKKKNLRKKNVPVGSVRQSGSVTAVHKPGMERLQELPIAPSTEVLLEEDMLEFEPSDAETLEDLVLEDEESVAVLSSIHRTISADDINDLASKWLARSHANPMVTTPKDAYALGITECVQDVLALLGLE